MTTQPLLVVCHGVYDHSFVATPTQVFYDKSDRWEVMAALHLGTGGRVMVLEYPHRLEDSHILLDWIDAIRDGSTSYRTIPEMKFVREVMRPEDWEDWEV